MRFLQIRQISSLVSMLVIGLANAGCHSVLKAILGSPSAQSICHKNPNARLWSEIGSGVSQDPYVICTAAQFVSIGKNQSSWGKSFALGANINLGAYDQSTSDLSISPIGTWDYVTPANQVGFSGTFDGQGYALQNVKLVAATDQGVAPFGYTVGAYIHDVKVTGLDASGTRFIGGLVAANKSSILKDVAVEGKISGTGDRLAGLVANNDGSGAGSNASITRAITNVVITGSGSSGGLAGIATVNNGQLGGRADITDSHSFGAINMTTSGVTIGGFVAYNIASAGGSAKFDGCSSAGDVTLALDGRFSGTFIGTNTGDGFGTDVSITRSSTTGSLSSPGSLIGGLIGVNNCSNSANCSITRSFVRGNLTMPAGSNNQAAIGLLVGADSASNGANISVVDSYAVGSINIQSTGASQVAGLVGNINNDAISPITVQRSYGSVTMTIASPGGSIGALFGAISNVGASSLTVSDSYWDGDAYATGTGTAVTGITSKTASQLKMRTTFPTWDFTSVWKINEGVSSPTL